MLNDGKTKTPGRRSKPRNPTADGLGVCQGPQCACEAAASRRVTVAAVMAATLKAAAAAAAAALSAKHFSSYKARRSKSLAGSLAVKPPPVLPFPVSAVSLFPSISWSTPPCNDELAVLTP